MLHSGRKPSIYCNSVKHWAMMNSAITTTQVRYNATKPTLCPFQTAVSSAPSTSSPPEAAWLPFIEHIYPNRRQETYFLPPLLFNRMFYNVGHFSDEVITVMQDPNQPTGPRRSRRQRPYRPSYAPGRLFTRNAPGLQPPSHQRSDVHDDQAQHSVLQCLKVLSDNLPQTMVVISQLLFRKYLDDRTNPVNLAASARLPSVMELSAHLTEGECDILIIHREQGIIAGEIKSVGGSAYFNSQPMSQQNRIITKKVEEAVNQVNNQATVLRHVVSDLNITVNRLLIFPNLSSAQLKRALRRTPVAQVNVLCL